MRQCKVRNQAYGFLDTLPGLFEVPLHQAGPCQKAKEIGVTRKRIETLFAQGRCRVWIACTQLGEGRVELLFLIHGGSSPQEFPERQTELVPMLARHYLCRLIDPQDSR